MKDLKLLYLFPPGLSPPLPFHSSNIQATYLPSDVQIKADMCSKNV